MFVAILLGSLKTPYGKIRRIILEVDTEHFKTGMLEQLIKYLPESKQVNELGLLKDEYEDLTEAEQFIATVCTGMQGLRWGGGIMEDAEVSIGKAQNGLKVKQYH